MDNKLPGLTRFRHGPKPLHIPQDRHRPRFSHQPGPPHPPTYSAHGDPVQRDPMVKRDPSDEVSQPRYGGPSRLHHHLPPFEHPGDPAQYRSNSYPPQSSMSASEHISGHPTLPPPPRDPYASLSYPSHLSHGFPEEKRKAQRAAQACDGCRTLKAKCDEGKPMCSSCREKGTECRYQDPPPKQQDKASAAMLDRVRRLESDVLGLSGEIKNFSGSKLDEIDRVHRALLTVTESNIKPEVREPASILTIPMATFPAPSITSKEPLLQPNNSLYPSTPGHPRLVEGGLDSLHYGEVHPIEVHEDEAIEEDEGGDPGPPKPPSIPVNHTTGAARLLIEPSIAGMVHGVLSNQSENYPILQEGKRGLLRLFGRGEGTDAPPGYDRDTLNDHGSDTSLSDTQTDASSPAPVGEEWGQMGGMTPPGNPPAMSTQGGISQEGMPDFSRETVLALVHSYKVNMNNMHPILIPSRLDAMVENFLKSRPESQTKPKQVSTLVASHSLIAGFIGSPRSPESPSNKRKRSSGAGEHQEVPNFWDEHKPGHPFRSISTALLLLVMALGKICLHKGKLPDVVSDKELESVYSPVIRDGPPSMHGSPSMFTLPSLRGREQPGGRRTSIEGAFVARGERSRPKNIDVIPGLAYFAFATDIIGNQLGGNSLQHVHANILAGLYHGQLARVMESHAYIHQACRGLQVILRPKLDRFKKIKEAASMVLAKDNPLIFAFWTCLQLESDIVAELPCPYSGILTFEEDMPGPNLQAAVDIDHFDPKIIESYSAQLFLRKHLNQLHNMFYKPRNNSEFLSVFASSQPRHFPTIDASEASLEYMDKIAPNMKWDEQKGEQAKDILHARLRAKFYGAKVITYRPFVLKILANSAEKSPRSGERISNEFKNDIDVPTININARSLEEIDPKAMEYAKKGILALLNSTSAFYKVGDPGTERLIVTNVWGTAHAQWGNVLTLQAAYMDPILKPLVIEVVGERTLRYLLSQTIAFLRLVASPTSALQTDIKILKHTGNLTGLRLTHAPQGPNTSSNFSSTAIGDAQMDGHRSWEHD